MFKNMNKKLMLIILSSVFVGIVLTIVFNTGASATSDDSFCLSCHDVPEFKDNFDATPHAQVGCINCHGEGFIKDKVKGTSKAFSTLTGRLDPNDYAAMKAEVPNDRCLSCHNIDNISRDQGVVAMHEDFVSGESDTTCVSCHNVQFFHGDLVGSTKSSDETTNEDDGAVEVSAEGLYSDSCANCHGDDLQGAVYADPITGLSYNTVFDILQDGHGGIDDTEDAELLSEWISNKSSENGEGATDDGAVTVDVEAVYSESCANCHGDDLQGAVYADPISGLPYDDLLDKLEDGHGGIDEASTADQLSEWISSYGDATEEDEGAVSVDPEGLYSDSCANCHGDDLQGAVYSEPITGMSYDDLLDKLEDGHGGIDDSESAQSLSQWISEQ